MHEWLILAHDMATPLPRQRRTKKGRLSPRRRRHSEKAESLCASKDRRQETLRHRRRPDHAEESVLSLDKSACPEMAGKSRFRAAPHYKL